MFNMYDQEYPRAKDVLECIKPESPSEPLPPRDPQILQKLVLNEIKEICRARCEYNHELITFFTSKETKPAEKNARLREYYPLLSNKHISSQDIALFVDRCHYDLKIFYTALKIILKYKHKKYEQDFEDFPIFLELREFFRVALQESANRQSTPNTCKISEDTTFEACMVKLGPFIDPEIHSHFDSILQLNNNPQQIGYQFRCSIQCYNHVLEKYNKFKKEGLKSLKSSNLPKKMQDEYVDLAVAIGWRLSSLDSLHTSVKLQLAQPLQDSLTITIFSRRAFYKKYVLEKALKLDIERMQDLEKSMAELKNSRNILKPGKTQALAAPPRTETETKTLEETEVETPQENRLSTPTETTSPCLIPPCAEDATLAEDTIIEQDLFKAYAEFRELKAKKLTKNRTPDLKTANEETKVGLEDKELEHFRQYNFQPTHIEILQNIFRTPVPHYEITWDDLEKIIHKCRGSIEDDTGSSRRTIHLPSFDLHTTMDEITQRGVHRSHQAGHQEKAVSRWYVNIFRTAFERAGMTLNIIHQLEALLPTRAVAPDKKSVP